MKKKVFKRQNGMTLVELVLTMVVLSVGLTGILSVMIFVGKNSVDPLSRWQAGIIGANVLEVLLAKSYPPGGCGPSSAPSPLSLCHFTEVEGELAQILPEMKSVGVPYRITITVQPKVINSTACAQVDVALSDQLGGKVVFTGIKLAKETDENQKKWRLYAF